MTVNLQRASGPVITTSVQLLSNSGHAVAPVRHTAQLPSKQIDSLVTDLIDTKDVMTFQGTSVEEIERAFRETIDDYGEFSR